MLDLKPKHRQYAYDVAGAVLALLAVYGVVSGDEADALLVLFAVLFRVARNRVDPEA